VLHSVDRGKTKRPEFREEKGKRLEELDVEGSSFYKATRQGSQANCPSATGIDNQGGSRKGGKRSRGGMKRELFWGRVQATVFRKGRKAVKKGG